MKKDQRYELIASTLRARGIRLSATHPGLKQTEVWVNPAKGQIRIVQAFREDAGYEVFSPVAEGSNALQDTLDAI